MEIWVLLFGDEHTLAQEKITYRGKHHIVGFLHNSYFTVICMPTYFTHCSVISRRACAFESDDVVYASCVVHTRTAKTVVDVCKHKAVHYNSMNAIIGLRHSLNGKVGTFQSVWCLTCLLS